jgi:hypothetical protein
MGFNVSRHLRAFLLALGAVLAVGGGLAAARPESVQAQTRSAVVPTGGPWCGLTADGDRVFLDLSGDGRFVLSMDVLTPKGNVGTRESEVRGVTDAQVVDSKFIFRQRRDETACERDPLADPRHPRDRCYTYTVEDTTLRGTFADPNHVSGSYSAQNVYDPSGSGDQPPRNPRGRPSRWLVTGTYTAWPEGFAPCP